MVGSGSGGCDTFQISLNINGGVDFDGRSHASLDACMAFVLPGGKAAAGPAVMHTSAVPLAQAHWFMGAIDATAAVRAANHGRFCVTADGSDNYILCANADGQMLTASIHLTGDGFKFVEGTLGAKQLLGKTLPSLHAMVQYCRENASTAFGAAMLLYPVAGGKLHESTRAAFATNTGDL